MPRLQTRYTYPMMGRPLRLTVTFAQKFHAYEYLGLLYGGAELESSGHSIRIYRFDGRHRSRFDMSEYDPTYGYWQENVNYDIDKRMSVLGYTLAWQDDDATHPDQFSVESYGRLINYDLDTTNPALRTPASYQDVWSLSIKGGGTLGPIGQVFRIDSRVYSPLYEKFTYWFNLTPYPNSVPYDHEGFPIAVGCMPIMQNFMSQFPLSAARTLLTNSHVEMVDAWRVQDEDGNNLDPEEYYTIGYTFTQQVFNFYFGCWDTRGLPNGRYRVRYRITFDVGPPGSCGTMAEYLPYFVDYWKAITIAKKSVSTIQTPMTIPYDTLASVPVATNLYPYLMMYDENSQRFSNLFASTISHHHEPRVKEPDYASSSNPQEITSFTTESSSATSSIYYLSKHPTTAFAPFVYFNGQLKRPSEPLDARDPSGVHDYYIRGNKLVSLVGSWSTMNIAYGYKGGTNVDGYANDYFSVDESVFYGGKYCFLLSKVPNLTFFAAHSQDAVISSGDYSIVVSGGSAAHFGCSVVEFTPANFASLNYWVWLWYSYTGTTTGSTYSNIQSLVDVSGKTTILLPRNLLGTMPTVLYHGSALRISGVDYEFALGSGGDPTIVTLFFVPTLPVQIWFN